ncbi:E3 ubiquitin-protein ligase TRIM9-like isoform X5 [Haliotis rufescens]|uniref:E3 ubiquitin-protein ligase TRIM9-like isoform X5 n=1 Tax=Haliotis rufescens TaxID=6454 RepID=UPI00201F70DB|nr:E3 ubiquitin-protein ligase TRIM9-like isoform X5 [Haliotis rufescens]
MTTNQQRDHIVCDFCEYTTSGTVICEVCLLKYCDGCFETYHPMNGPLSEHQVTRTRTDTDQEKCPLHNERCLHFCVTCSKRLCPHCLVITGSTINEFLMRPHQFHDILTTEQHIEKQKKKLLEQIEKVSHAIALAEIDEKSIEDRRIELELSWLSYKQQVRQEFVSLHDLLLDREKDLLDKMQKCVEESLESMTSLEDLQKTFTAQEAILTEENIKLVQDRSKVRFLNEYKNTIQRCEELYDNARLMPNVDDITPTFLKMPFSLLEEKLHLENALQFQAYDEACVEPKSRMAYVDSNELEKPMRCFDLWDPPSSVPASTVCVYNVEVRTNNCSEAIKYTNLPIDDFVFNSIGRVDLQPRRRYVLKVVPVYTCRGCGGTEHTMDGLPVYIMVLTGPPPPKSDLLKRISYFNTEARVKEQEVVGQSDTVTGCDVDDKSGTVLDEGRFQVSGRHIKDFSFEETRFHNTESEAGVNGRHVSFVLDDNRYQTEEQFLSHHSFEECRYHDLEMLASTTPSALRIGYQEQGGASS